MKGITLFAWILVLFIFLALASVSTFVYFQQTYNVDKTPLSVNLSLRQEQLFRCENKTRNMINMTSVNKIMYLKCNDYQDITVNNDTETICLCDIVLGEMQVANITYGRFYKAQININKKEIIWMPGGA